jgi:hypothetical protein
MNSWAGIFVGGVLSPKRIELLSIAFDASYRHMYAPGTRRHLWNALKVGATMEEIMEVLKAVCRARRASMQSCSCPFWPRSLRGARTGPVCGSRKVKRMQTGNKGAVNAAIANNGKGKPVLKKIDPDRAQTHTSLSQYLCVELLA